MMFANFALHILFILIFLPHPVNRRAADAEFFGDIRYTFTVLVQFFNVIIRHGLEIPVADILVRHDGRIGQDPG